MHRRASSCCLCCNNPVAHAAAAAAAAAAKFMEATHSTGALASCNTAWGVCTGYLVQGGARAGAQPTAADIWPGPRRFD
eukprot:CAMPEP_0202892422 /NCGR_PEP_ID=MMETSP1392-20130828/2142_1 /ASSEMBLY_ACC=CAM_ASM_000868 /TAXON_ID=225041 /ORGANISM="Chlamydomonas chlamydogama, Strain SAG 11-48b" /LENGTH=78 /DNA_ID=CAMNT_0049576363 /DNA_START=272 /DNA_END=508 /DNA_ORIENTATION=-